MVILKNVFLILYLIAVVAPQTMSEEIDSVTARKLKDELEFNRNRRSAFKSHDLINKSRDREREKGLAEFLENEEKFTIEREKGLYEYKKSKPKQMDDDSVEARKDLMVKQEENALKEKNRRIHIQTRDKLISQYTHGNSILSEEEELGLIMQRPRYDLRRRKNNKWLNSSTKNQGASSSSNFSNNSASNQLPPPDYSAPPVDNFEDLPPPPPAVPFEEGGYSPFDSGFGEAPVPPPPPPPVDGWDF